MGSLRGRQGLRTPPRQRPPAREGPVPAGRRPPPQQERGCSGRPRAWGAVELGCALNYRSYHKRISRDHFLQNQPPPPQPASLDVLAAPPYGGVKNIAQSEGVQTGVGRFPAWRAGIWSGRPGTHSEPRGPAPAGPRLDNALQTPGTTDSDLSGARPAPEPTQRVALSACGEVTAWGLGTRMQG